METVLHVLKLVKNDKTKNLLSKFIKDRCFFLPYLNSQWKDYYNNLLFELFGRMLRENHSTSAHVKVNKVVRNFMF